MAEYTHSDDERAFWACLSDEHIRDGYATIENQGGEYVSPIRRAAFESWLAAHDARVKRDAAREALDGLAEWHDREAANSGPGSHYWDASNHVATSARHHRDTHYGNAE